MPYLWEISGLSKAHAGKTVIAADSLGFEPGRITALCGPNGAGKSTLLAIVALLEYPDQGEIKFQGKILSTHGDWFAARRAITLVAQDPYAFPGSVSHNAAYGLRLRGRPESEIKSRVAEALAAVSLAGLERRRARTLSGGELQRLALARALVCDPLLLLLDEPTAHVDAGKVRQVEDLIASLRRDRNMTVVIATHGHDQACRIADTVLHIEHGAIQPDTHRIVPARIRRDRGQLILTLTRNGNPLPAQTVITSLELAGDSAIIRLANSLPDLKVPLPDLTAARPLVGETAAIEIKT